jgi:hypothetical protein
MLMMLQSGRRFPSRPGWRVATPERGIVDTFNWGL